VKINTDINLKTVVHTVDLSGSSLNTPAIVAATNAYTVLYKPSALHTVPLQKASQKSLFDWCITQFPEVQSVRGKLPWEGGIVHRLDYHTKGLVLCARTQAAFDALWEQQDAGLFYKEYRARSAHTPLKELPPGFPEQPPVQKAPFDIHSAFRPFGIKRQAVRPVLSPSDRQYQTAVLDCFQQDEALVWTVGLYRGFRHQIRCHCAWLGYPLINDSLYGYERTDNDTVDLCAYKLQFRDPESAVEQTVVLRINF
jgi:23S rRNA pseudouridine1911/1915/1917 synthase